MTQRGRPRHPGILTPREWEVLALVREGLSNPQIGERLGITTDAAKYHVSEILSKLGVGTREEAAAWRPEPAEAPVLRPAWARAISGWWPAAAWVGAAVALAGVGILAWGVLRSGGEDDGLEEGTETPTSSPTTATVVDPSRPVALGVGEPFPLTDQALILETGCNNCDGGTSGFVRVVAGGNGSIEVDELFDPAVLGYPSRPVIDPKAEGGVGEDKPYITGFAAAPDASDFWVSLCVRNSCGDGGMDGWQPGSETVILRSTDGGASWAEVGRVDNSGFIVALASPDHVLVGVSEGDGQNGYARYPGMEPVSPPAANALPLAVVEDHVLWRAGGFHELWVDAEKVLTLSNSESVISAFGIASPPGARSQIGVGVQKPAGSELLIAELTGEAVRHYDYDAFSLPAMTFGKGLVFGNATIEPVSGATPAAVGYLPVAFDLTTNSIRPISQFAAATPGLPVGRNEIIAVQAGPFAEIAGADPCAPVQRGPTVDSEVLACLANGVLVVDVFQASKLLSATPIDGWLEVLTQFGVLGVHGYVRESAVAAR